MLLQRMKPTTLVTGLVLVIVVLGVGVAELAGSPPKLGTLLPKPNLFGIAAGMQTTTGSMLQNTKALQDKVGVVNQDLSQLAKQESILNQQQQTGKQLTEQLTRQQELTQGGVNLMKNILSKEKTTEQKTGTVSHQTAGLSSQVLGSESSLGQLAGAITTTNQESIHLNSQMDALLSALNTSMDEFKLFGQVDQLLPSLGGIGGLLPSVGQGVGKGVTGVLSGVGSSVGNTLGGTVGNTVGGTLGGLTGGLSGHH